MVDSVDCEQSLVALAIMSNSGWRQGECEQLLAGVVDIQAAARRLWVITGCVGDCEQFGLEANVSNHWWSITGGQC